MIRSIALPVEILTLYFLLFGVESIVYTSAVTCSTYTTAATCYAQRASCHWSGSVCATGAPTSCSQFMQDTTGCASNSAYCVIQTYNQNYCVDSCARTTAQLCVSSSPPRQDCMLNYTSLACQVNSTALSDGCNNKYTSATCAAPCIYDPYLNGNCFKDMTTKIMPVFPCSYWSGTNTTACQFQSYCVYASGTSVCEPIQTTANTADNSTSFNLQNSVYFLNPTVTAGTTTFSVTVQTVFATGSQPNLLWPFSVSTPQIQVLFPVQNIAPYAQVVNGNCSSAFTYSGPPLTTTAAQLPASINYIQQYVYNYTTKYGNLSFGSDAIGLYLDNIYNNPLIGPSFLVKSALLSTDLSVMQYTVSFDMTLLLKYCSQYGVSMVTNAAARVFSFPISYIEQNPQGAYVQYTQTYSVTVPTSGVATVTSTTFYPELAYPLEIVFPQMDCAAGYARQAIKWSLIFRNVFDTTKNIGPRSIADISTINPSAATTLQNCYGDILGNFTNLGCDDTIYACATTFSSYSKCRQLTADGLAFNKCSYAQTADRIADMGSNIAYPTTLDGKHTFFINVYSCPDGYSSSYCSLINNSPYNLPDQIIANIQTTQYALTTATLNAYQVQAGTLPYPTALLSQFTSISDTYYYPNGVYKYDPNLFNALPLTIAIQYPTASLQTTNDLRLNIDFTNFTMFAVDTQGVQIASKPVLTFAQIRNFLTYTTKNDYDAGCGSASRCTRLPACTQPGLLGCDGFSISTLILKQLLPANGYGFNFAFRMGLPNADGSTPNARTQQSFARGSFYLSSAGTDGSDEVQNDPSTGDPFLFNNTVQFGTSFSEIAQSHIYGNVGMVFYVPPEDSNHYTAPNPTNPTMNNTFPDQRRCDDDDGWNDICKPKNWEDMFFCKQYGDELVQLYKVDEQILTLANIGYGILQTMLYMFLLVGGFVVSIAIISNQML